MQLIRSKDIYGDRGCAYPPHAASTESSTLWRKRKADNKSRHNVVKLLVTEHSQCLPESIINGYQHVLIISHQWQCLISVDTCLTEVCAYRPLSVYLRASASDASGLAIDSALVTFHPLQPMFRITALMRGHLRSIPFKLCSHISAFL